MQNVDARLHVRGESVYLDDIPLQRNTLFACVYDSPVAHGLLKSVDITTAQQAPDVVCVLLAKDIAGENQIGGIVPDEELLADGHVHFQGVPIAVVIARSEQAARHAASLITCDIEPLEAITDPRIACERNELIVPPKQFKLGDTASAFATCAHVFEGRADINADKPDEVKRALKHRRFSLDARKETPCGLNLE